MVIYVHSTYFCSEPDDFDQGSKYHLKSQVFKNLQYFKHLIRKQITTTCNYLAYVLYGVFSEWEYKSLYIKSK